VCLRKPCLDGTIAADPTPEKFVWPLANHRGGLFNELARISV